MVSLKEELLLNQLAQGTTVFLIFKPFCSNGLKHWFTFIINSERINYIYTVQNYELSRE